MILQTDLEFQQNEIKRLDEKCNVEMFSPRVSGGKSLCPEKKIREFKKLFPRQLPPTLDLIQKS